MNDPKHIAEQEVQLIGETRTKYQNKTGRKPPYEIPADTGAKDEVFSGPKVDPDNIVLTGYRLSPDMPLMRWNQASEMHPAGENPAYIHFGALTVPEIMLNEVLPDVVGLGEGEETPFAAQKGEMPEGEGGKFLDANYSKNFVQAEKVVKSDVPCKR